MPRLIDAIGKMSVNNKRIGGNNIRKAATALPQKFPREKLTLKNSLKTKISFGDEGNIKKFSDVIIDNDSIFAPWCSELNRQPKTDCFKSGILNTVKPKEVLNEAKEICEAYKLSEWQRKADAIIEHFFKQ